MSNNKSLNKEDHDMVLVKIEKLNKKFGRIQALNNFSIKINTGIYGLIGPNGAGKTTIINILIGLLRKDSGDIKIFESSLNNNELMIKNQIGICFTNQNFPHDYLAREYLDYIGSCYKISRNIRSILINYIAKKLEFENALNREIVHLSAGTKQKVGIAQSLICLPTLAILDEPFANLDPHIKIYATNLFKEFHETFNVNFLISSHNLEDLSSFCTNYIFINNGELLWSGASDEITNSDLVAFYMNLLKK